MMTVTQPLLSPGASGLDGRCRRRTTVTHWPRLAAAAAAAVAGHGHVVPGPPAAARPPASGQAIVLRLSELPVKIDFKLCTSASTSSCRP